MIRALHPVDAPGLRALRLDALRRCPHAFGASHDEAARLSDADFANRIATAAPGAILGAFDGPRQVGMAGILVHASAKQRHKAVLWGVYVQPGHTRRGLGRALVTAAIAHARGCVTVLHTSVVTENAAAQNLYLALGFIPWGLERRALRVDGRDLDEAHLALDFTQTADPA